AEGRVRFKAPRPFVIKRESSRALRRFWPPPLTALPAPATRAPCSARRSFPASCATPSHAPSRTNCYIRTTSRLLPIDKPIRVSPMSLEFCDRCYSPAWHASSANAGALMRAAYWVARRPTRESELTDRLRRGDGG